MEKNMNLTDRTIRILFAVTIGILFAIGAINGAAAVILGIFAVIFVVTGFVGFCPAYKLLHVSTGPRVHKESARRKK